MVKIQLKSSKYAKKSSSNPQKIELEYWKNPAKSPKKSSKSTLFVAIWVKFGGCDLLKMCAALGHTKLAAQIVKY